MGDKDSDTRTAPPNNEDKKSPDGDPFRVRLSFTRSEYLKMILIGITVVPFRVLVALISLILAWIISCFGLRNIDKLKPIKGWRKPLKRLVCGFGRVWCRCCGFSVTLKGQQVSSSVAPVMVVAPHSSFFDCIAVFWSGLPFILNREDDKNIPLIGKCAQFSQAIYVNRDNKESRSKCKEEIKRRVNPDCEDQWDQFLIFPEGTTTNRKALMKFKPGGFLPGQPIQPLLIRYNLPPDKDTITWSWDQPHGLLACFIFTICTLKTEVELEFLSPYFRNEHEKTNPVLFANNVRKLMADKLKVSLCDLNFEDIKKKYEINSLS